jgi:hypothetical protein
LARLAVGFVKHGLTMRVGKGKRLTRTTMGKRGNARKKRGKAQKMLVQ